MTNLNNKEIEIIDKEFSALATKNGKPIIGYIEIKRDSGKRVFAVYARYNSDHDNKANWVSCKAVQQQGFVLMFTKDALDYLLSPDIVFFYMSADGKVTIEQA